MDTQGNLDLIVELGALKSAVNLAMGIVQRTGEDVPEITELIPAMLDKLRIRIIESLGQCGIKSSGTIMQAIQDAEMEFDPYSPFVGYLVFKSAAIKALEFGTSSFDMKPGLLAGSKARTGLDGDRYNIIRFRHGTGSTAGTGTGLTGGGYRPRMPTEVKKAAQGAEGKSISPLTPWGQRSSLNIRRLAKSSKTQWKAAAGQRLYRGIGGISGGYTWKASPWAGLRREGAGAHTSYATYRAVSAKSDPYSWIHPGITGVHFIRKALNAFRPEAAMMTTQAISAFFTRITDQYGNA